MLCEQRGDVVRPAWQLAYDALLQLCRNFYAQRIQVYSLVRVVVPLKGGTTSVLCSGRST